MLKRLSQRINTVNTWIGRVVYWLTLAMVLVGSFNAVTRYIGRFTGFDLSSNAYIESQWYLFSLVFLLGAAYTLKEDAHVRVDVLYGRLSRKGKAWINLGGDVLFLIPFCILMIWVSWPAVMNSWAVLEISPDPGGLPRYPIKSVIPLAFFLLILQGISDVIRQVATLREQDGEPDSEAPISHTPAL
jgi:TRAP-type mannitol/chloroaromatic compound transport system permease small subunit